jgi:hypothetical protein
MMASSLSLEGTSVSYDSYLQRRLHFLKFVWEWDTQGVSKVVPDEWPVKSLGQSVVCIGFEFK